MSLLLVSKNIITTSVLVVTLIIICFRFMDQWINLGSILYIRIVFVIIFCRVLDD
jgi:hypothetical protein